MVPLATTTPSSGRLAATEATGATKAPRPPLTDPRTPKQTGQSLKNHPMAPRKGHPSQNFGAKKERKEGERQERVGRRESASLVPALRAVTQTPTLPTRATRKAPEIRLPLGNPFRTLQFPDPDPKRSLPRGGGLDLGHPGRNPSKITKATRPPRRAARHENRKTTNLPRAPAPMKALAATPPRDRIAPNPLGPGKEPMGPFRKRDAGRIGRDSLERTEGGGGGGGERTLPLPTRKGTSTRLWSEACKL
jgi:hypothetical protein